MKPYAPVPTSHRLLKGVALAQLGLALIRLILERGTWPSISMMIVGALLMIFCAKEAVNDERVEHLKLKAAKAGLLFGTLAAMLLYVATMTSQAGEPRSVRGDLSFAAVPLSAFDVLILIMTITLGCYYYWRWQDGRVTDRSG
jgi:hypothetical protein